jgi:hypothetical protein
MELGLGGWGKIVFSVGGMALTGAQIGMAYPPFGVFIGSGVGLMVGAVLSVLGVFSSQAATVRKAQAKMQEHLNSMRSEALAGAAQAHDKFMAEIRSHVDVQVRSELVQLHTTLAQPGKTVEQQIKVMDRILRQVEGMPYGTVQAVRL